jgi:hypothetical protein
VTETTTPDTVVARPVRDDAATIAWLEGEFPGWRISVDVTAAGWATRDLRSLWIARRDGHHPQAELSAAKLHSRLADYLHREERRQALAN